MTKGENMSSDDNNSAPAEKKAVAVAGTPMPPKVAKSTAYAKRISAADSKFLTHSIQLEESDPPQALKGAIRTIGLLIIAFVLWASFTPFIEKVTAGGTIQPDVFVQNVQALTGGRVQQVYVTDGVKVTEGTPMLKLDTTTLEADLHRVEASLTSAQLEMVRLDAELTGTSPDFSTVDGAAAELVSAAGNAYSTSVAGRSAERKVLGAQLEAANATVNGLQAEVRALEDQVDALRETRETRKSLLESGAGTRIAYLDARQRYSEIASDLAQRMTTLAGARVRATEVEQQIVSTDALFVSSTNARLETLSADVERFSAEKESLLARLEQMTLTAPVDGIVSGLSFTQTGAVVSNGDAVASIVPESQQLLAQVKISPRDIGQVSVGQSALVRVDGYRFGRVGGVDGEVTKIAADPSEDPDGKRYFYAWVTLSQSFVGDDPTRNRIISGMAVSADVQIGEKSLMAYLIRPVRQSLDSAFSER